MYGKYFVINGDFKNQTTRDKNTCPAVHFQLLYYLFVMT